MSLRFVSIAFAAASLFTACSASVPTPDAAMPPVPQASAALQLQLDELTAEQKERQQRPMSSEEKGAWVVMAPIMTTSGPTISTQGSTISTKKSDERAEQRKRQLAFVADNGDRLRESVAQGSGDYVESFLGLLGCADQRMTVRERGGRERTLTQQSPFADRVAVRMLQEAYPSIYAGTEPTPELVVRRIKVVLGSHPYFAEHCEYF